MHLPFTTSPDDGAYLEPARSPLLPLCCLLAIAAAIVVVDARLGSRLALITAAFAALSLTTRLPRVLVVTVALCLVVAAIAVLGAPGSASVIDRARRHAHNTAQVVVALRPPGPVSELLGSQQQLFHPAAPEPPSFDQLCPPPHIEQLEVDAAIRARSQTTIDDFTTCDA